MLCYAIAYAAQQRANNITALLTRFTRALLL
jgi:hypothetical protein